MAKTLQVLRDIALLLARFGLGGIMIAHGWRRWQQLGIDQQVAYLQNFQTPYPEVAVWGAVILELVGGIFLVVGALTPLVALAYLVEQALIISYTNWHEGPWIADGGWEYNVALGLLALLFLVFGGGRVSIDRLFRRAPADEDDIDDETTPA